MNKPFKILATGNSGLNDFIGNILYTYHFFSHLGLQNIELSCYSRIYSSEDLASCLNFTDKIKLVNCEQANPDLYDYVSYRQVGTDTISYSTQQFHELFTIKKEIIESAQNFNDYVGVHFRHIHAERFGLASEHGKIEFLQYKYNFLKLHLNRPTEKYLITSDIPNWQFEFPDKKNISYILPTDDINARRYVRRSPNLKLSLLTLCALASCRLVYATNGNFVNLIRWICPTVAHQTRPVVSQRLGFP